MTKQELQVGKQYYFDDCEDEYGTFLGYDDVGDPYFSADKVEIYLVAHELTKSDGNTIIGDFVRFGRNDNYIPKQEPPISEYVENVLRINVTELLHNGFNLSSIKRQINDLIDTF